jgi:uncharacterized membrane protein
VARDLFLPRYKTSFIAAVRARLLRNYWGIYAVLLFSWVLKVLIYPHEAHSWAALQENLRFGTIPWWVPLCYVAAFIGVLVSIIVFVPSAPPASRDRSISEHRAPAGVRTIGGPHERAGPC